SSSGMCGVMLLLLGCDPGGFYPRACPPSPTTATLTSAKRRGASTTTTSTPVEYAYEQTDTPPVARTMPMHIRKPINPSAWTSYEVRQRSYRRAPEWLWHASAP